MCIASVSKSLEAKAVLLLTGMLSGKNIRDIYVLYVSIGIQKFLSVVVLYVGIGIQ